MINKEPTKSKDWARVTFELPSSLWAGRVNLVGEFNDWDGMVTPMTQDPSDGNWRVTVDLEAGRRYRFRYLVDGEAELNDWRADDHVQNPQGSYDPVVDLTQFGCQASP
jgi:1,4-alpha-glucan branching enzyme